MAPLWRISLQRIQERFDLAHKQGNRLAGSIVHATVLRSSPAPLLGRPAALNQLQQKAFGYRGAFLEPRQLLDGDDTPAIGIRPYLGADEKPLLFPTGEPIAWDPGFTRTLEFHGNEPHGFRVFEPIARQAGVCLSGLPPQLRKEVWKNLPAGSRLASDHCALWADSLFELAWQNIPGVPLMASERCVWSENTSITLRGYSRIRAEIPGLARKFPDDSPESWYSIIEDVFSASVAAIDVLLSPATINESDAVSSAAIGDALEIAAHAAGTTNAGHPTKRSRQVDAATEARDKWIYDQCCKMVPYDKISILLKRKPKSWGWIESKQGIQQAAARYAKRHTLPPIPLRRER